MENSERQLDLLKKLTDKITTSYVEGLKELGLINKSWTCTVVCGGGCTIGCGGGCTVGCLTDGPIPVGDVLAAGGAGGGASGSATGVALS